MAKGKGVVVLPESLFQWERCDASRCIGFAELRLMVAGGEALEKRSAAEAAPSSARALEPCLLDTAGRLRPLPGFSCLTGRPSASCLTAGFRARFFAPAPADTGGPGRLGIGEDSYLRRRIPT